MLRYLVVDTSFRYHQVMDPLEPTFTIIIPTLGRPTLWDILNKFELEKSVTTVIAVFEIGCFNKSEIEEKSPPYKKVQFIEGSRPGVSANLNDGLDLVKTNYFGFFSDDDFWIQTDFKSEINYLELHNVDLLLGASKINRMFTNVAIRPKIPIFKPSQILDTPWWLPSPFYLSLNNLIAGSNLKNFRFKEDLYGYEDIEWLLRLEASGIKFKQNFTIRSHVNIDDIRNSKRDDKKLRLNVYNHLAVLNKIWAEKYISNISPRNHILASNFIEITKIAMEKKRYLQDSYFLKNFGVGLLQMVFSASLRCALVILRRKTR